jgi:hypothetical protein
MKSVTFSVFGKLVKKVWLLMPRKKTQDVLQKGQKANKIREYYYIKYATDALRVIAWVVLALGFISSLGLGITTGGIEGGLLTIIVMIGSFLAWLILLAARELLKLFVDVKENTRDTAARYLYKKINRR